MIKATNARYSFGLEFARLMALNDDLTIPDPDRVVGGVGPFDFSAYLTPAAIPLTIKLDADAAVTVNVNLTVNPIAVGHLGATIQSLRNAVGDQLDSIRIHHLWFITPSELEAHRRAVSTLLGGSAPGAQSHCIRFAELIDPIDLSDEMSELDSTERLGSFPSLTGEEIRAYYSDGFRSNRRCLAPFRGLVVKPDGDVRFCPDEWIDDYALGNIRQASLAAIWRNERARRFRSVIRREGSFPGCNRCSWMYCF